MNCMWKFWENYAKNKNMKTKKEKIIFLSEGQKVRGTLVKPIKVAKKIPGVIFFHGMTSSEKGYIPIAEKLARKDICVMTLNIRGHGNSEGDFSKLTVKNAIQDGLNAYKFLVKQAFVDRDRIGLCGSSVGGVIVSVVSKHKKIKSLILKAPAVYTKQMIAGMTYKKSMEREDKIFKEIKDISNSPPVKAMLNFKGNLLAVLSEKDNIIPNPIQKQYISNAKKAIMKKIIVIKDADHSLSKKKWKNQFIHEMLKWFTTTL